jgi:hypothetical protein
MKGQHRKRDEKKKATRTLDQKRAAKKVKKAERAAARSFL